MHDDMKFDDFLRGAAKDYRSATTPRTDDIWAAIAPEVAKAIRPSATVRSIRSLRAPAWIGIGIAATLMLGVAIGRMSNRTGTGPQQVATQSSTATRHAPVNEDSASSMRHSRATALDHLAETEIFLTTVRADLKAGRTDAERAERSRELLARTRLLLGASNTNSAEVERLLEDLELLLAEIAALPRARSLDQKLLDESMREGNILPRIRATLPAQQAGT